MESLLSDVRYAVRNLLRRPGFTIIAVVTLALGIGANTAIFSAINALLLKPLPFPELDRVVAIWDKLPNRGLTKSASQTISTGKSRLNRSNNSHSIAGGARISPASIRPNAYKGF